MKTIVVDDEPLMIETLKRTTQDLESIDIIGEFNNYDDTISFAKDNYIEAAFLDVEIGNKNGIELAKQLRKINDEMIIIFISAYYEYIKYSNIIGADYYLVKPYKKYEISRIVEKMEYLYNRLTKRIQIVTFGKFEVYIDKMPMIFESAKAKELLAFLVDNDGKSVKEEEVFYALWESMIYTHNNAGIYRLTLKKLKKTLEKYNVSDLLFVSKQGISIDKQKCKCDLYDFFKGDKNAVSQYFGEYLTDYSWGEKTNAKLFFSKNNKNKSFMYE